MPSGRPGEGEVEYARFDWWRALEHFGARLRAKREQLGLTQVQMADRVGVRQATISRIENGQEAPKHYAIAQAISICYGLNANEQKEWFQLLVPIPHHDEPSAGGAGPKHDDLLTRQESIRLVQSWLNAHSSRKEQRTETSAPSKRVSDLIRGERTLEGTDLLSSLLVLQPEDLIASNLSRINVTTARPYELAIRLMAVGNVIAKRSWLDAIAWFRSAEKMFGPASNQAARAALAVAQMLLYLGDYGAVRNEIIRVQMNYGAVLDPETTGELYRIKGWLEYYEGNFSQSVKSLLKNVRIFEQIGMDPLGDRHFLGRVYSDWGQSTHREKQANLYYHKAELYLDASYQIRLHRATGWDLAYDLFRKAQLARALGRSREAAELRAQARGMFGADLATLHIDLEEAQLSLEDNGIGNVRAKGEEILKRWEEANYPKGMADALRFIGQLEYQQGNAEKSLELYLAAVCVYPFERHPNNRHFHSKVQRLIRSLDQQTYKRYMRDLQSLAEERRGYFSALKSVKPDRSDDIQGIFREFCAAQE